MCIASCGSVSKVVYQTKVTDSKLRYYVTDNPNYRKGEGKFYARVDSGNVRIFYSFQSNNIYKTYDNASNYVYTLVFDRQLMLGLTSIDSIVLTKADNLLDSLKYSDLKRAKNATGFVIEIARH
jgi:hypothetical protein